MTLRFDFGLEGTSAAGYTNGVQDNTHFQEQGGLRIAGLVVEGIRELGLLPLMMYLR